MNNIYTTVHFLFYIRFQAKGEETYRERGVFFCFFAEKTKKHTPLPKFSFFQT